MILHCPLCNGLIALRFAMHVCAETLTADEYVDEKKALKLMWSPDQGWQSYIRHGNDWDVSEKLAFKQVVEWVNDAEYNLQPV